MIETCSINNGWCGDAGSGITTEGLMTRREEEGSVCVKSTRSTVSFTSGVIVIVIVVVVLLLIRHGRFLALAFPACGGPRTHSCTERFTLLSTADDEFRLDINCHLDAGSDIFLEQAFCGVDESHDVFSAFCLKESTTAALHQRTSISQSRRKRQARNSERGIQRGRTVVEEKVLFGRVVDGCRRDGGGGGYPVN